MHAPDMHVDATCASSPELVACRPDFNYETAVKAAGNVAGLCNWVSAMVKYHNVARFVRPKQEALETGRKKMLRLKLELDQALEVAGKDIARLEAENSRGTQLFEMWSMSLSATPKGLLIGKMLHDALDGFRRFLVGSDLLELAHRLLALDETLRLKTAALIVLQLKLGCEISDDAGAVLSQSQKFFDSETGSTVRQLAEELRRCDVLQNDTFKQTVWVQSCQSSCGSAVRLVVRLVAWSAMSVG